MKSSGFYSSSVCLVTLFLFISCKYEVNTADESHGKGFKVNEHTFEYVSDTTQWKCVEKQNDLICFPGKWKEDEQSKMHFFALIDVADSNTFLSVTRYDQKNSSNNPEDFLRMMYSEAKTDSTMKLDAYSVFKLDFGNHFSYYCEFDLSEYQKEYKHMTMLFQSGNLLYDISMKCNMDDYEENKIVFQTILYKFRSHGKHIFNESEKLMSIKEIDMEAF